MTDVDVIEGMPEADYHAHPALSNSQAKLMLPPNCPAMYPWRLVNPEEKPAFDFGHAAHALALGVGAPIVVVPDELLAANGALSTKAAKEFVAQARAEGSTPLKCDDFVSLRAMVEQLHAHPIAGPLLDRDDYRHELSVFWHDPRFGVDRRARLDLEGPIVVDYKTAQSADPAEFARSAARYGYHLQDAYYCDAVEAMTGERPRFVFVVQSKEAPYLVTVVQLDEDARQLGRERVARAIEVFAECAATGEWPSYAGDDVAVVDLPRWAYLA